MLFKKWLFSEMPMQFRTHGDWDAAEKTRKQTGQGTYHYSAKDIGIFSNPAARNKIIRKFENVPYDFNVWLVLTSRPNYVNNHPYAYRFDDIDWIIKQTGIDIRKIPPIPGKINIYITEWQDDNPSAWMIAHRFAHMGSARLGLGWLSTHWNEASQDFMKIANIKEAPQFDKYIMATMLLTMKSAREGKLNSGDEPLHEMMAQYIMTGSVKLKFNASREYARKYKIVDSPQIQSFVKELEAKTNQILKVIMEDAKKYVYIW